MGNWKYTVMLIVLLTQIQICHAFNVRQTSNNNGLSNSAILALDLDDNGYLWIGTCDGINIADGTEVKPFSKVFPNISLSGNIIEAIRHIGNGRSLVLTNYGLDCIDISKGTSKTFPQFQGQETLCADEDGNVFVITENRNINYLSASDSNGDFRVLTTIDNNLHEIKAVTVRDNRLWLITEDGIIIYNLLKTSDGGLDISEAKKIDNLPIKFAKVDGDEIFVVDRANRLLEITPTGKRMQIIDLDSELRKRGDISDLVHDRQGNFFMSFATDGAMWIGRDDFGKIIPVDLGLKVGVFCLEKSPDQDVAWIGSDCQGIYTYWDGQYSIRSYDFSAFNNKISHPVRAIFVDDYKNLWLGTKGDGLLKVSDFNEFYPRTDLPNGELFTSSNSELAHNSVFAFDRSARPLLWIATELGLNYYSYKSGRIEKVKLSPEVKFIHGVYEENDSTLWMATLGYGVIKGKIKGRPDKPEVSDLKFYTTDNGNFSSNFFFSLTLEDNGKPIFCNRGNGLFVIKNDSLVNIPYKESYDTRSVNDVFAAIISGDSLWIGTGHGLIQSNPESEKLFFGPENGFINSTVHDMLRDDEGDIWVSTNKGLVRFDPKTNDSETYGRNYGLSVTEFSDGAAFNTGHSLLFGGIDGIIIVNKNENYVKPPVFSPTISLRSLEISGKGVSLPEYFSNRNGKNQLTLSSKQNHFTITFAAPDFINAHNYTYSYTLDGHSWINNGTDPIISFNEMDYGNYTLKVRYLNRATGVESDPYTLNIYIRPPWYLSTASKIIYAIIIIGLIILGVYLYIRRQKERQREEMSRMEQAHKEEVYEEKLKFFTNITHEFCTPLTLIYGPCERILTYPGSDDYIRRYVGLVRTNAERLNVLIQELIDFRRMETGHKTLKIRNVDISKLCNDIIDSFSELSERNNINFVNDISEGIDWNTDFSCLRKILYNLISNAFKYTSPGGTIKVGATVKEGKLVLNVYNTGKGLREEDKERIFNRYSVLDNVEKNAIKGISSRNGLGMAICHSMVEMLHGNIAIESEVGKYADFIVSLPALSVAEPIVDEITQTDSPVTVECAEIDTLPVAAPQHQDNKRATILVIDDNKEILTLLTDSLSDYNVFTAESAEAGLEYLKQSTPDIIVSDIMMPGVNGVELTRQIKGNKHTMHIPLILLSAKNSIDEKVEGIESGADAYIGKPFSLSYLKAVVKRLLENRSRLREYYNTSASVFEHTEGKLMRRDDKDYLSKIIEYIDAHIEDSELSPEQLAAHLKTSVRNLYRKFKELDRETPNDFIKNHRINHAAKLLLTTNLTVQEIIYRCGFTNRSHFYKEFDKRFGMTPKDYRKANTTRDTSLIGTDGGD